MRTFQLSDSKSHKFWNIDVKGKALTVTFGKIGTAGQSQTKTFKDDAAAQAEADKLVKEKTRKGYKETTPKAGGSEAEAFEAALRANPHDLAGWCAFADYLVEQGDPRGEFMQTQIALEDESRPKKERDALKKKEAALLAKHEKEWVGDWPDTFEAPTETEGRGQINHTGGKKYGFKRGVLTTVNFTRLRVNVARAFVRSLETRFVRELFIGDYDYEDQYEAGSDVPSGVSAEEAAFHVLLRWPHLEQVRRFQYGWLADEKYDDFCHFQCHQGEMLTDELVRRMPNLEELLLFAQMGEQADAIAALPLRNLRVLQLYHGWRYPLEELANNPALANLTHLLCHPHALEYGASAYIGLSGLQAVCRSPRLKNLTHLRLRLTDFGDAGVREIVESGALKRLRVLDLRHGCITDEGAVRLASCPDLKNLTHLDLSRNAIGQAGYDALVATGVSVDLGYQHGEAGPNYDGDLNYLGQGDYE